MFILNDSIEYYSDKYEEQWPYIEDGDPAYVAYEGCIVWRPVLNEPVIDFGYCLNRVPGCGQMVVESTDDL